MTAKLRKFRALQVLGRNRWYAWESEGGMKWHRCRVCGIRAEAFLPLDDVVADCRVMCTALGLRK